MQQTVHRNGDAREVLAGGFKRSEHRIQRRGDARVQGMRLGTRRVQERSVRIRRAIAADRSANDTAQQATMTRETDISAEHVQVKWRAKGKPILSDSRPRCCKLPFRGASAPTANQQSRSGAVVSSGVGEGPEANHGVVNYHNVTLTEPQPKSRW